MAERSTDHDEAALAVVARHALHDEELIAALADRDLDPADADRARALIERCSACHDLHRDLTAITATIRASGTAHEVAAVRYAPRDFRLPPEMAGGRRPGLSPTGLRARLAGAFASFGRPLGASLATFGLVGLLVGSLSLGGLAAPGAVDHGAPAATAGTAGGELTGSAQASQRASASIPVSTFKQEQYEGGPTTTDLTREQTSAATWLFVGSIALLAVGLALIVLGTRGRRARELSVK